MVELWETPAKSWDKAYMAVRVFDYYNKDRGNTLTQATKTLHSLFKQRVECGAQVSHSASLYFFPTDSGGHSSIDGQDPQLPPVAQLLL
jgi:hypothetical protein